MPIVRWASPPHSCAYNPPVATEPGASAPVCRAFVGVSPRDHSQLIAGAKKHLTNGTQVHTFAGDLASVTVDQAVAELQTLVDNRTATVTAQATARDKVKAERAAMPALVAFMSGTRPLQIGPRHPT